MKGEHNELLPYSPIACLSSSFLALSLNGFRSAQVNCRGSWKPIMLYYLKDERQRFGQLQRLIPHATKTVLTQQLRELESDGIINRRVFEQVLPKVEYSLTGYGKTLSPILALMAKHRGTCVILNGIVRGQT